MSKNIAVTGAVFSFVVIIACLLMFYYSQEAIYKIISVILITLGITGVTIFNTIYRMHFKNPYVGAELNKPDADVKNLSRDSK